eukprot:g9090.t1
MIPRESLLTEDMAGAVLRDSKSTKQPQQQTSSTSHGSLMHALLEATRTSDFAEVISSAWSPGATPSVPGTFPNLSHGDLLLNAIPLSQKLLACMAARSIDIFTAYACADLVAILGLDQESAMLLRPKTILESIIRLFTSDKETTRVGALRCMTTLITGSKEYCQCFVKNNIIRSIFDSIRQEKSQSVAAYACKTAISLAYFLAEDEEQLEALLSDIIPGLLAMLSEDAEVAAKLSSLQCLRNLRELPSAAEKIKQDVFVKRLASLLCNDDKQVEALSIELFGPYVTNFNSEELRQLPPLVAYRVLTNLDLTNTPELEQLCLVFLDSLLVAIHHNTFKISDKEVQLLSQILIGNNQLCASKTVDILIVAWDIEIAQSLASIEGFLSQLPQVMTVTQPALRIIHSMLHARAETCQEMAKVIGPSEIQSLRKQMEDGSFEAAMLVLDIFHKMIKEGRLSDLTGVGVIRDVIQRIDSESTGVRQRSWRLCKHLLEAKDAEITAECIRCGVIEKCGNVFSNLHDHFLLGGDSHWKHMGNLFQILKLVSCLKAGARSICETGFVSLLARCLLESESTRHPEVFEIFVNLFEALPASSSRLFIENEGLKFLSRSIQSNEVKVKRESFRILKLLNFKESAFHLQDSNLIPELCLLLQNSNTKLTCDVVTVLCKISKGNMDNVCAQIVQSGLSSALWSASRSIPANSEEHKALWKVIQGVRSVEAIQKASSRRKEADTLSMSSSMTPSRSRRTSTGSNVSHRTLSFIRGTKKNNNDNNELSYSNASFDTASLNETPSMRSLTSKGGKSNSKRQLLKCRIPSFLKKGGEN